MRRELIIFTDLDRTLLDSEYSFRKALPALDLIRKKNIPLVLCSSKTKSEIEHYRKKLRNTEPFIACNGGGIFIPKGHFNIKNQKSKIKIEDDDKYSIIKLGADYPDLRDALIKLRKEGFEIKGFGDMNVREVAELTGLSLTEAGLAKKRLFDEPFLFKGDEASLKRLKRRIRDMNFKLTESVFYHIMGDSDKGRAVAILKEMYSMKFKKMVTIALGDGQNDLEMLQRVDHPVIVRKPDGNYDMKVRLKGIIKADGVGPEGWNKAVLELINKFQ